MSNNLLNKINEVEGIIKEIKDNLKIKKDTEKDKQFQELLLQKEKYDKQNKEYIQLKKKQERQNQYKYKIQQDKIKYNNQYLDVPYRSLSELNFEDLFRINTIKDKYEKEKEDMVKRQMDTLENVKNIEQKNMKINLKKKKKLKIKL
jgi:hypothetical protein